MTRVCTTLIVLCVIARGEQYICQWPSAFRGTRILGTSGQWDVLRYASGLFLFRFWTRGRVGRTAPG